MSEQKLYLLTEEQLRDREMKCYEAGTRKVAVQVSLPKTIHIPDDENLRHNARSLMFSAEEKLTWYHGAKWLREVILKQVK